MYDYNSVDGKLNRIEEIKRLVSALGDIPLKHLHYHDYRSICQYLTDIQQDLEKQVAPTIAKRRGVKRYRYHYLAEGIVIMADNGAEAEREYSKLRLDPPAGDIELTDMVTGEKNIIRKIIINGMAV